MHPVTRPILAALAGLICYLVADYLLGGYVPNFAKYALALWLLLLCFHWYNPPEYRPRFATHVLISTLTAVLGGALSLLISHLR